MGRYPEALYALRRSRRLCPPTKIHLVYYWFGHLYQQKGKFRLAERWYRRAVELRPTDATSYIFLGALLAVEGWLQEAADIHEQATRCKEGSIDEAFHNLGLMLRALGRYADAQTCFQRALEIDSDYGVTKRALLDVEHILRKSPENIDLLADRVAGPAVQNLPVPRRSDA